MALWDTVFATVSIPCCMLVLGMFVRWWKSLEIIRCVVPVVLLGVIQLCGSPGYRA